MILELIGATVLVGGIGGYVYLKKNKKSVTVTVGKGTPVGPPIILPLATTTTTTVTAPAPATVIQSPPVVATAYTNGMSNPRADGAVQLQAFADEAAKDSKWAPAAALWYFIKDATTTFALDDVQKANYVAAGEKALQINIMTGGTDAMDAAGLAQISDNCLAFHSSVGVSDLPTFISNCNARYAKFASVNDLNHAVQQIPSINHNQGGVVGH